MVQQCSALPPPGTLHTQTHTHTHTHTHHTREQPSQTSRHTSTQQTQKLTSQHTACVSHVCVRARTHTHTHAQAQTLTQFLSHTHLSGTRECPCEGTLVNKYVLTNFTKKALSQRLHFFLAFKKKSLGLAYIYNHTHTHTHTHTQQTCIGRALQRKHVLPPRKTKKFFSAGNMAEAARVYREKQQMCSLT